MGGRGPPGRIDIRQSPEFGANWNDHHLGLYGVPGALRIYGDNRSLPVVVSPQLSGWYWLPRDLLASNALMIDYQPSDVSWMCSSATLVGHLTVPYGVHGLEQGAPVKFCVLNAPIQQDWSGLRNFS